MSLTAYTVSDEKDLHKIYRLRYKIYCYEWGFEKPENHPDEIVTDIYDQHALHFAVKNDVQKIVGAISLILPSPEGFPAEKYCELNIDPDKISGESVAEISRLVIHRSCRRRSEDKYIYGPDEERRSIGNFNFPSSYSRNTSSYRRADDKFRHKGSRRTHDSYSERRRRHEVIINLYKAIYRESKRRQITHWYGVMTKGVMLLLDKFGFHFKAIGDPVDFHGIRTPFLGDIESMEQRMSDSNPELYAELTADL